MSQTASRSTLTPDLMASGTKSSFGQAIHFITEIKLQELETQRLAYKEHAKVLDTAKAIGETGDNIKKVETLAKAIKSWTGSGAVKDGKVVGTKLQLDDLEFWLQQAKKDPSFSPDIAKRWADILEQHIRHTVTRFDAARLFGKLFNEWLTSGDSSAVTYQGPSDDLQDTNTSVEDDPTFEKLGRKEMYEQKEKLISIVFDDHPIDVEKLEKYLEELFEREETAKSLEKMRKELKDFSYWLKRKSITVVDVRNSIAGLLTSGLMNEEKRTTLKAFQESDMVLTELASVLNMRMANLKSWSWPKEGILVEFRRHLNGKYRYVSTSETFLSFSFFSLGPSLTLKSWMPYFFNTLVLSGKSKSNPRCVVSSIARLGADQTLLSARTEIAGLKNYAAIMERNRSTQHATRLGVPNFS